MFIDALAATQRETAALVGLCDISRVRMNWHNERLARLHGHSAVPTYLAADFDAMIRETRPDVVIVTTVDAAHDRYVIRAMELGCDVICEKPMTTDAAKAAAILDAVGRTGRRLQVTFNLRYVPHATKVYELIRDGAIGQPTAVDFSYALNTQHGGDYFRRWHRQKDQSGGLLVHKSTHHFDLVNWWVASYPEKVFAMGGLRFYGRANAIERGDHHLTEYDRYTGAAGAEQDPFALHLDRDPELNGLYYNAEAETGYIRDRNVFGDQITAEDTMAVMARYRNGVTLNYSLVCYSPREGWRAVVTGTRGQIEIHGNYDAHLVNGANGSHHMSSTAGTPAHRVVLIPMFGAAREIEVQEIDGGHGGGDTLMMRDLFAGTDTAPDPFRRAASHVDGAASVLLGFCANESIATGLPVSCDDLLLLPATAEPSGTSPCPPDATPQFSETSATPATASAADTRRIPTR
jgi:predicted dehydrogenase